MVSHGRRDTIILIWHKLCWFEEMDINVLLAMFATSNDCGTEACKYIVCISVYDIGYNIGCYIVQNVTLQPTSYPILYPMLGGICASLKQCLVVFMSRKNRLQQWIT